MISRFYVLSIMLLGWTASIHAENFAGRTEIESFPFLAGLCVTGADMGYIDPPQCDSFFRTGGEEHVAEMFLDAARIWSRRTSSRAVTKYYYDPDGERLVIKNSHLAKLLFAFYVRPDRMTKKEVAERIKYGALYQECRLNETDLLELDHHERLSFVAGIYARCCRNGSFHSRPSVAMRAVVRILRAEGCEVSKPILHDGTPTVMTFNVNPSKEIDRLFSLVDKWNPSRVEWRQK